MAAPKHRTLAALNPPGAEPGALLLATERLIIRRYVASDAAALAAAASHASVAANLRDRFPSPYTAADAEAFVARHAAGVESRYPLHGAIFVRPGSAGNPSAEPLFVGAVGVVPGDDVYYRGWELGYWLTPSAWGRGYMTEAVRAFTRWVFATWPGLNRLEATVFSKNTRSARTLNKCGFVQEGRRRLAAEKNGEVMDDIVFGLIRSDLGTEQA
ncbi:Uncharacterized protein TCAP_03702 [Tolypocladium capitatum]|uniref:N-acetyltransferase domain-containing protein n=1 Tax=Tolypocladium capitatum TaxID=45235 RepID=A0A2K3QFR6_9HYPO|nr:Uncharacterized protein TCAP_03702 [Tolypocladium capitatum]